MSIIGPDNRVEYSDSAIVDLVINYSGSPYSHAGTGYIVDSNRIVTAGHCAYDSTYGWATSITVYTAYGDSYSVSKAHVPSDWISTAHRYDDYALLEINTNVDLSVAYGAVPLAVATQDFPVLGPVSVAGYAGGILKIDTGYRFSRLATDEYIFYYQLDTIGGNSGGPILFESDGEDSVAIGIHTNGEESLPDGTLLGNSGIRFHIRHLQFFFHNTNQEDYV
jgi:V8-like Glu-specific endopeptidase